MVTAGRLSRTCDLLEKLPANSGNRLALPHAKKHTSPTNAQTSVRLIRLQVASFTATSCVLGKVSGGNKLISHTLLDSSRMGLSGRKIKQRIPQDPRNLSWADGSVDALFVLCTFVAQPSVHRCISLWFHISIQAGLRSHRQKCHPRCLGNRPDPTPQSKVHSLFVGSRSFPCCAGTS